MSGITRLSEASEKAELLVFGAGSPLKPLKLGDSDENGVKCLHPPASYLAVEFSVIEGEEHLVVRHRQRMGDKETTTARVVVLKGISTCLYCSLAITDLPLWNFGEIDLSQFRLCDFARFWNTRDVTIADGEAVRLEPGSKELNAHTMKIIKMLHDNPTYANSDIAKLIREHCDPEWKERIYGPDSNPIVVHDRAYL